MRIGSPKLKGRASLVIVAQPSGVTQPAQADRPPVARAEVVGDDGLDNNNIRGFPS
jgi:hypothetical protein